MKPQYYDKVPQRYRHYSRWVCAFLALATSPVAYLVVRALLIEKEYYTKGGKPLWIGLLLLLYLYAFLVYVTVALFRRGVAGRRSFIHPHAISFFGLVFLVMEAAMALLGQFPWWLPVSFSVPVAMLLAPVYLRKRTSQSAHGADDS